MELGTPPFQLPEVDQLVFAPPPVQVDARPGKTAEANIRREAMATTAGASKILQKAEETSGFI